MCGRWQIKGDFLQPKFAPQMTLGYMLTSVTPITLIPLQRFGFLLPDGLQMVQFNTFQTAEVIPNAGKNEKERQGCP